MADFVMILFISGKNLPVISIFQKGKSTERWNTCSKSNSGKGGT